MEAAKQAVADSTAAGVAAAQTSADVGVDAAVAALDSGSTYDEALAIGQSVASQTLDETLNPTTTAETAGRVLTDDEMAALKKFRKNCPC